MNNAKTILGVWGARKTALAMQFCVSGLCLTQRGDVERVLGSQMDWELKLARETGLVRALEALAGNNPGQWQAESRAIVSHWHGQSGIAVTSVFQVPMRKTLTVTRGAVTLLSIHANLDDAAGKDSVWFLPGAWTQELVAVATAMQKVVPPMDHERGAMPSFKEQVYQTAV